MNKTFLNTIKKNQALYKFQRKFIGQGAVYQSDNNNVRLKGKLLKSRRPDMPTVIFIPELFNFAENYEKFFLNPNNKTLDYRNVWLVDPRNSGDSDHHDSLDLQDCADDFARFMDEKKITTAAFAGHGHGAKIASVIGSSYLDKTSSVMCIEGGPLDNSFHPAWNAIRDYIKAADKISQESNNLGDAQRKIDAQVQDKRWAKIIKDNMYENSGKIGFKCNMRQYAINSNRRTPCFTKFNSIYGLFPGRAFVQFASHSDHIYLATNTIPIYKFFLRLEGRFATSDFNMVYTEDDENSK